MEWQASAGSASGFTKEHIYAGQRRIAQVHTITGQAAKVTHSHPDPSGSPAMLSDASGLVSARETYRPYGDKLLSPNTSESAGFANKAFDANTNLSYMSARYYNPTLGRFISPDPVHFVEGNIHSFNRYAYANNNPMRFIDPTGLLADALSGESKSDKTDKTADKAAPSVSPTRSVDSLLAAVAVKSEKSVAPPSPLISPTRDLEPTLAPVTVYGTLAPVVVTYQRPDDDKVVVAIDIGRSPTFTCTKCGGPHGGVFGLMCPNCTAKHQQPGPTQPVSPKSPP